MTDKRSDFAFLPYYFLPTLRRIRLTCLIRYPFRFIDRFCNEIRAMCSIRYYFRPILAYVILSQVIDWISVLTNSLWILGLALILSAFSYHYWQAETQNRSLRTQLNRPPFLKTMWAGFALVCAGLAGTSERTWEAVLWAVLIGVSIFNLYNLTKNGNYGN